MVSGVLRLNTKINRHFVINRFFEPKCDKNFFLLYSNSRNYSSTWKNNNNNLYNKALFQKKNTNNVSHQLYYTSNKSLLTTINNNNNNNNNNDIINNLNNVKTSEERLNEAINKINETQYEEAIKLLEEDIAINKESTDVKVFFSLGYAYQQLGNFNLSIEYYNKALNNKNVTDLNNIDKSKLYNYLGVCLRNIKRYEESLLAFSDAIKLNPNDSLFYGNKGVTYDYLQEPEKAMECYEKSFELDSANPPDYIMDLEETPFTD